MVNAWRRIPRSAVGPWGRAWAQFAGYRDKNLDTVLGRPGCAAPTTIGWPARLADADNTDLETLVTEAERLLPRLLDDTAPRHRKNVAVTRPVTA